METLDFGPTAQQLTRVVTAISDDQLTDPTPCAESSVGDLLDHLVGLTMAFTAAATKTPLEGGAQAPSADIANLDPDWRERIPRQVAELAQVWQDPAAYDGMTMAGPVEMPGEITARVELDEILVHGWDLAVATGQPYPTDPAAVEVVGEFVAGFDGPSDGTLFGPPVAVPDDAPAFDRLLGLTGRDPAWDPATA